jgi:hypothetical protein
MRHVNIDVDIVVVVPSTNIATTNKPRWAGWAALRPISNNFAWLGRPAHVHGEIIRIMEVTRADGEQAHLALVNLYEPAKGAKRSNLPVIKRNKVLHRHRLIDCNRIGEMVVFVQPAEGPSRHRRVVLPYTRGYT